MTDLILAAGAVPWRRVTGETSGNSGTPEVEILLVHRPKYDDWSLPKGKREPGEHILLTAVREVFEETSVRPVLGPRLRSVEYLAHGRPKQVDYWAALAAHDQAAASHEIDEVCWLPRPQALDRLSYPHDADVIASLQPRATVPIVLVRHASAGRKRDRPAQDLVRPLDAEGALDALLLADLLACFAPRARVISSPALRCIQSVRPYAERFGGSVEAKAVLTVPDRAADSFMDRTDRAHTLRHLFRNLATAGQPVVACLHGENLPLALAAACSVLGAPEPADVDPSLPKGAFLVLHVAAGTLVALERYELLGSGSSSTVTSASVTPPDSTSPPASASPLASTPPPASASPSGSTTTSASVASARRDRRRSSLLPMYATSSTATAASR
jgi:8-oxo-dGTP diphosphatase